MKRKKSAIHSREVKKEINNKSTLLPGASVATFWAACSGGVRLLDAAGDAAAAGELRCPGERNLADGDRPSEKAHIE